MNDCFEETVEVIVRAGVAIQHTFDDGCFALRQTCHPEKS